MTDKKGLIPYLTKDLAQFNYDQRLFVYQGCISACVNTIISGVFMTGYVLWLGASEASVGIVSTIPLLSSVLQIFTVNMWHHFRDHKRWTIFFILLARLLIVSVILIPLVLPKDQKVKIFFIMVDQRTALISFLLLASYVFGAASGLKLNFWTVYTVERSLRGTFFSTRDRVNIVLTTALSLGASRVIDVFKKGGNDYIGFVFIFSCVIILAVFDFTVMNRITYPEQLNEEEKLSIKNLVKIPIEDKTFCKVLIYLCLLNFGMNIAMPYFNVYMLNHLKLDYTKIMLFTILQISIQVIMAKVWGRIANVTSWSKILMVTTSVLGIQFFVWIFVTKETLFLLPLVFVIAGLIGSGMNMASFNLPYGYLSNKSSTAYLSLVMAFGAISGFLGSITGANIISSFSKFNLRAGFIHFGSMQLNMGVSAVLILVSVAFSKVFVQSVKRNAI